MSVLRSAKAVFTAIVVLASLTAVASANAAAWLGPVQVGNPGISAGDSPLISQGSAGDSAIGFWDEGGGGSGRTLLVRKRAGQPFSAPAILNGNAGNTFVYTGVDGSGDVTAAYTTTGPVTTVAQWPAGAAAPTQTTLSITNGFTVYDLKVNAAGDAVIVGLSNASADVVVGYRSGFNGAFAFHRYTPASAASQAVAAINASGMAVVVFRAGTNGLFAATRTAGTDWPGLVETVTIKPVQDIVPTVGIDAGGNAWAAFVYNGGAPPDILRTALRPPGGGWQESGDLSSTTAGFQASQPQIAVNPSGTAILVWKQTGAALSDASIQARYGSTGTGLWGPIQPVNDAGADTPVVAIGDDGRSVVAWERETVSGNVGQARVREPGAGGTFGDIHNLSALHANYTKPSIATDGRGNFPVVSAPYDGVSFKPLLLSVYDAAPPTVATPSVTGTLLAGEALSLGVAASDDWATLAAPAWTFGDGGTGSGATVQHVYAAAGIYPVHVVVTDSAGNSTARDIAVTVAAPQATLTSAKFSAKWKVSRVTGALTVVGTAPRAGTYVFDVFKGKSRKIHVSSKIAAAGAFTRKITLPAKFLPGTYTVTLVPGDAQVKGATRTASLAAPASGVVDVAFLSGARNGTAARTLTGATTIWASFHFAAKPKGTVKLTWYKVGKKLTRIGSTNKSSATKIVSYLRIGKVFVGTYQAVLSRNGVVIARASVKAKKR